ncbi:MAG: 23S rRNA (guanosine(2251)-2'-O)-methyltransferase RlmB [Desulfobacterales bacterium]
MKTELLYGIHPVAEALAADRRIFHEVFVAADGSSRRLARLAAVAAARNIPVRRTDATRLNRLVGDLPHQGTVARVGAYPLADLADVLAPAPEFALSRILVLLDTIVDPQNLGAIIRTALGVGAVGIVIARDRAAGPSPTVSKASAGAMEHVRLVQVTNLAVTIRRLQEHRWWVYGMDRGADLSVFQADLTGSVAVVIGGEEKGIRPLVKQRCDRLLSIPQQGPVASLNASVAGAVAMYEVLRQGGGYGKLPADGAALHQKGSGR